VIDPCTVNRQDRLIVIAILIESTEVIIANWANNRNKSRLSLIIEINRESGYSQSRSMNQIQTEYPLPLRIQPITWWN
jgi:hypothetical protein